MSLINMLTISIISFWHRIRYIILGEEQLCFIFDAG